MNVAMEMVCVKERWGTIGIQKSAMRIEADRTADIDGKGEQYSRSRMMSDRCRCVSLILTALLKSCIYYSLLCIVHCATIN